jgi:hypothetical protein
MAYAPLFFKRHDPRFVIFDFTPVVPHNRLNGRKVVICFFYEVIKFQFKLIDFILKPIKTPIRVYPKRLQTIKTIYRNPHERLQFGFAFCG